MIGLETLNAAPAAEFCTALANIYEHAAWVAAFAERKRPFATVAELAAAMQTAVRSAEENLRIALIRGHPELADKTKRASDLTDESAGEQQSAGLDRLSDEDYERFHRLNHAYRERFGHPFIICVRRHGRDSILRSFERRLANTQEEERATSLAEIDRIAALRLAALVTGAGSLAVHGVLSTHVLDTHAGIPAAGMALTLSEIFESGARRLLLHATTNADGRTEAPLIADRPLPIGCYELCFDAGRYFSERGVALSDPPFLGRVPLAFAISEPEGHYHVPLLLSPWSYSTYRGS